MIDGDSLEKQPLAKKVPTPCVIIKIIISNTIVTYLLQLRSNNRHSNAVRSIIEYNQKLLIEPSRINLLEFFNFVI